VQGSFYDVFYRTADGGLWMVICMPRSVIHFVISSLVSALQEYMCVCQCMAKRRSSGVKAECDEDDIKRAKKVFKS